MRALGIRPYKGDPWAGRKGKPEREERWGRLRSSDPRPIGGWPRVEDVAIEEREDVPVTAEVPIVVVVIDIEDDADGAVATEVEGLSEEEEDDEDEDEEEEEDAEWGWKV